MSLCGELCELTLSFCSSLHVVMDYSARFHVHCVLVSAVQMFGTSLLESTSDNLGLDVLLVFIKVVFVPLVFRHVLPGLGLAQTGSSQASSVCCFAASGSLTLARQSRPWCRAIEA